MNKIKSLMIKCFASVSMMCIGLAIGMLLSEITTARAAGGSITVESVDYFSSTIILDISGEDTGIYISDAKQKKWEFIPIVKDAQGKFALDLSWVSVTKEYTLSIKGNVSTEPVKIVLPKQENKFKASYNIETGEVTFTNDNGRTVQWRKKNGYHWENVESAESLKERLSGMISNGASIVFRLAPVNGNGTEGGQRPSKEVTVTIPKKTAAPSITVNNSLMAIAVTKDMEYRYTDRNGIQLESDTGWKGFDNDQNVQLSTIASKSIYSDGNPNPVEQYIQFRTKASKSKQVSNNTTVRIPAQIPLTEEEKNSFGLEYISSNAFVIKVTPGETTQHYEYCIISKSDFEGGVDLSKPEKLSWKDIPSTNEVTVTNTKNACDNGSMVYIRRKASGSLGDDDYKLASDAYVLSPSGISYPGDPSAVGSCVFDSIAGTCRKENSGYNISFTLYGPGNAAITKLRFGESSSEYKELTAEDFKSTVAVNADSTDDNNRYIITTTIYSTKAIESYLTANSSETEVTLTGMYCIGNSTEYCDFDTSPLKITLKPASGVIVPNQALIDTIESKLTSLEDVNRIGFTKTIKRVFMSNRKYGQNGYTDNADQDVFRTLIKIGAPSETPVTVANITYDAVPIEISNEYAKTYAFEDDADQYIILELNADKIEDISGITLRDTTAPVYITLNNGEVLTGLTMNLMSSAKLKAGSTGVTLDPDVIKAETSVTTVDADGTTTIINGPNRDYYIEYDVNITGYKDLTALSATFNGASIFYDADNAKGRVYLSVEKIKAYAETLGITQTGYVEIGFSNGFKIKTGYRLTLLKNGS
ncbi:MAG: hypothetical protein K6E85_17315 [Lachnospiraceae bacterium]|nr:hypothetical protein [Lachnospiraceae bacterium]